MIPPLVPADETGAPYRSFLAELRLRGFDGEISDAHADRTVFATDNSIYQVPPQAVVFPRHELDVVRVAKLAADPRFADIRFSARGGGTGTNGQSLTDGIAVDLSRHMNSILEIDAEGGWARVQAGVVKDQLNDAVRAHGLFFAPELSPSNRATIGGMIATDASGQGSVLYGKTRDHVLALRAVLLDGTAWHSVPLSPAELEQVKARPDRVGQVHRLLETIETEDADLIRSVFPKLNRCVTGYDLVHLRDRQGRFDLNSVLCGAEGSLAFVTEATIRLTRVPKHSALFAIRYATFDAALRDAASLMQLEAASSETVDSTVLRLAREDAVWLTVQDYFPDDPQGPASGVNLVEFLAEDPASLAAKISRVEAALAGSRSNEGSGSVEGSGSAADSEAARGSDSGASSGRLGYAIARDPAAVAAIWSMRKKSVGLLGNLKGDARPMPFVEDTVVPPEHLADYIAEFRAALDRRGLVYGMFGHVDAGCLHVRPALDMKDPDQERLIREITDEVFQLTRKYRGVLWGEHGKGFRSEYAPAFFGPLYPRMQQIKAAFDPHNQLNPGKIAAPPGRALTAIDAVPTRGQADRRIPAVVRLANDDALHCNGNAACFNYDPDDPMCPSWKALRERRHSPKGRASLMREWLRQLAEHGVDPTTEARRIREEGRWVRWQRFPRRALNSWTAAQEAGPGGDFSLQVKEAMDGCLACKSCVGQCPIKVDVPSFRSRFLELHHDRYLRPPRDWLVASLERWLPAMAARAGWMNGVMRWPPVTALLRGFGLVALPTLSRTPLMAALAQRGVRKATPAALAALTMADRQRSVVIVPDGFTSYYDSAVLLDWCELIQRLGFKPWIAPYRPTGKPQHVLGMLGRFQQTAAAQADALRALAATGVELVGVDPSMTLVYRAEYPQALGAQQVPPVALPQEWLARHRDALPRWPASGDDWMLAPHCTERTNAAASTQLWREVFGHFGATLRIVPTGCCGMAGLYGHERRNRQTADTIYRQSWARWVADPRHAGRLLATGFSCRCQVALMDRVDVAHPVQLLLRLLKAGEPLPVAGDDATSRAASALHHEET